MRPVRVARAALLAAALGLLPVAAAHADTAGPAGTGASRPAVVPEPPPPEFPKKPDGTLDREALIRELRERASTPEARAEAERRRLEDSNEPGYRISPLFGSELVFFSKLDRTQSSWGVLYRAFMRYRWLLAALVLLLAGGVFVANQLRWRRLERDYLAEDHPERGDG